MYKGTVKWFNSRKGYGFISRDDEDSDTFVHYSNIKTNENEFANLYEGDKVKFDLEESDKGPQAVNVEIIEKAQRQQPAHATFGVSYF